MTDFALRDICHVCRNDDGDRFVGIKADADDVAVYFPLGYRLPPVTENEHELRRDIAHLISVLATFTDQKDKLLAVQKFSVLHAVDFPINAYMTVITDYMTRSYYTETEQKYVTSDSGKIDWRKTIRKHQPIIQSNGSPVYTKFEIYNFTSNDRTLITRVHEYCVYEAFQKLGWLFSAETPRQPQLKLEGNKNMFIGVVRDKMSQTFIDNDKRLFQSMIDMLSYLDDRSPQNCYYFGTDNFEYVWERMIDKVFGVKNKRDYFPRTYWRYLPKSNSSYKNDALEPDTIMIPDGMGKAFVLDAKYYRFGATGNVSHLPPSSSINKQITYGEHVSTLPEFADTDAVFNAFIMPYNQTPFDTEKNPHGNFLGLNEEFEFVGEAYGDWKPQGLSYEAVQGIVVDTRYLMYHYSGNTATQIRMMADKILAAYEYHRRLKTSNHSFSNTEQATLDF
jgi:hypothetical protein